MAENLQFRRVAIGAARGAASFIGVFGAAKRAEARRAVDASVSSDATLLARVERFVSADGGAAFSCEPFRERDVVADVSVSSDATLLARVARFVSADESAATFSAVN